MKLTLVLYNYCMCVRGTRGLELPHCSISSKFIACNCNTHFRVECKLHRHLAISKCKYQLYRGGKFLWRNRYGRSVGFHVDTIRRRIKIRIATFYCNEISYHRVYRNERSAFDLSYYVETSIRTLYVHRVRTCSLDIKACFFCFVYVECLPIESIKYVRREISLRAYLHSGVNAVYTQPVYID